MKIVSSLAVLVVGLMLAVPPADAMSSKFAKKDLVAGRKANNEGEYEKAITLISMAIRFYRKNADAYNDLGFAYRKSGRLEQAAAAYKTALSINPDHKGALEYQGELYLKQKNVKAARGNIARLGGLCPSGCKELAELKRALADYQAQR